MVISLIGIGITLYLLVPIDTIIKPEIQETFKSMSFHVMRVVGFCLSLTLIGAISFFLVRDSHK